jgi:hypothetical protein
VLPRADDDGTGAKARIGERSHKRPQARVECRFRSEAEARASSATMFNGRSGTFQRRS